MLEALIDRVRLALSGWKCMLYSRPTQGKRYLVWVQVGGTDQGFYEVYMWSGTDWRKDGDRVEPENLGVSTVVSHFRSLPNKPIVRDEFDKTFAM